LQRILLVSDTHSCLDEFILNNTSNIDELWHAGDIGNIEWVHQIEKYTPRVLKRFVFGNIDGKEVRQSCPEWQFFALENMSFLILHIGGNIRKVSEKANELIRLHKPDVFICGHSHILQVKWMESPARFLYMNPGAAGVSGFHKARTMLRFDIREGALHDLKVIQKERAI
jgi:putative phosphoesterase